ncbi:putative Stigma-specific Stig1 family protein [Hibiscus syriacus]|uniref:Stigma-specific Stig1 family protein n=1 Tax=Hibiscus syriacus TaxID=106335 RepID=A0A6A3BD37_HIBSY|nr:putative Stigma-specific Stig1 family protein [Hibiscus syriacus]
MVAYKEMNSKVNTTKCRRLSTLEAQFAWNYDKTRHNQTQITVLIGIKLIPADMGWLAWGVNPDVPQMVGTRAIIAIKLPNQTTPLLNTYNITEDIKLGCKLQPSIDLDFRVQNMAAVSDAGFFAVFVTLILPDRQYDISSLNHVWQVGRFADGLEPMMHSTSLGNFDSKEVLDLRTGRCRNIGRHRQHLRKVHGILNIIGWGTLLPIGVIVASIGWGIGLLLGHESKYYSFHRHRVLGVCIFGFITLQMLAFRFKPGREDEYRKHWNVYHHFLGYALLVMIPVNIYEGIKILRPDNRIWKWAYDGILVFLAMVVLALEIYTWAKFLCAKYYKKGNQGSNSRPTDGGRLQKEMQVEKTDQRA